MTRTILSRMLLVAGAVAVVACGPRLKPVEYEEPKSSGSGSYDEDESYKSSAKKKSSAAEADTSESSTSSSASHSGGGSKGGGCEGKSSACGSPCTECAPGDMDCMEVLVMKQCNAQHKCVPSPVDCSAADKADKDKKKSKKDE